MYWLYRDGNLIPCENKTLSFKYFVYYQIQLKQRKGAFHFEKRSPSFVRLIFLCALLEGNNRPVLSGAL